MAIQSNKRFRVTETCQCSTYSPHYLWADNKHQTIKQGFICKTCHLGGKDFVKTSPLRLTGSIRDNENPWRGSLGHPLVARLLSSHATNDNINLLRWRSHACRQDSRDRCTLRSVISAIWKIAQPAASLALAEVWRRRDNIVSKLPSVGLIPVLCTRWVGDTTGRSLGPSLPFLTCY